MSTLRDCITKAAKLLSPANGEALLAAQKQLVGDGYSAESAATSAVQTALDSARAQLAGIMAQLPAAPVVEAPPAPTPPAGQAPAVDAKTAARRAQAKAALKDLFSAPAQDYEAAHPATNANVRILAAHYRSTNILASASADQTEQSELPDDRIVALIAVAKTYIADGIDTPAAVARTACRADARVSR